MCFYNFFVSMNNKFSKGIFFFLFLFSDFQPYGFLLRLYHQMLSLVFHHLLILVCHHMTMLKVVMAAVMTIFVHLITIITMSHYILAVTITVPHKLVMMIHKPSSQNHGIVLGGKICCIPTTWRQVWVWDPVLWCKLWEQRHYWDLRKMTQCAVPTQMELIQTMW